MSTTVENANWSQLKKIAFRFFFTYFGLFILLKNNGAYPFYQLISSFFNTTVLYKFIPWVGKIVLGVTYPIRTGPNGSGDTTYDYVLVFVILITAIITTIIWTIFDKKSKNYKRLYYWLTLAIRLYVGLMLINYGLVKVIKLQFSSPSLYRLTETYGESSPMGLAWTFLGFSNGYNIFMGIAEIAAVLLLFRRTLTLGAIITLMTTANVMAVNYFYDVPVKILSTHLVLMTLFLLAYNFKQLFQKEAVSLTTIYKPKLKKQLNYSFSGIKYLLLFYVLGYGFYNVIQSKEKYNSPEYISFLKGLYEVDNFKLNDSIISHSIFLLKSSTKFAFIQWAVP